MPASSGSRPTHARHVVLALTVAAYMITYMDRTVFSTAAPAMRKDLGISLLQMGTIFSIFRWSYALFQVPGGWLGDWIGPRRALTMIVTWWSVFTSLTAAGWSAASLVAIRFHFRRRRGGRVSNCHSLSFALDPSRRTRFRAGHHARGVEDRRCDAAGPVTVFLMLRAWLARADCCFWRLWIVVVRGLVFLLSRHAGGARQRQRGGVGEAARG